MTPHVPARPTDSVAEIETTLEAFERFMQLVSLGHAPEMIELTISMAQMKVLYLLAARRQLHMSDLGPLLGVSTSTVSGLVDRLVEAGLATRHDDPVDRRHVVVGITAAGDGVVDRFRSLGQREMRSLLEELDPAELAAVRRAIDILTVVASRKDPP